MKSLKCILFLLTGLIFFNNSIAQTKAQKNAAKTANVKAMVDNRDFTFTAEYANPLGGGHRYLTSDYDIRVKKDSLVTYLPYFGRAYFDVPYNSNEGGIKFTSTNFTYKATEKKKGGWDVVITPKDAKYINRLILYISPEGYTNAQFTITNRDGIGFDGYLAEKPLK